MQVSFILRFLSFTPSLPIQKQPCDNLRQLPTRYFHIKSTSSLWLTRRWLSILDTCIEISSSTFTRDTIQVLILLKAWAVLPQKPPLHYHCPRDPHSPSATLILQSVNQAMISDRNIFVCHDMIFKNNFLTEVHTFRIQLPQIIIRIEMIVCDASVKIPVRRLTFL